MVAIIWKYDMPRKTRRGEKCPSQKISHAHLEPGLGPDGNDALSLTVLS